MVDEEWLPDLQHQSDRLPDLLQLFGADGDPVGQVIRIRKIPFVVIGVLAPKGQSDRGQDQDDTIFVPLTTAQKKIFGVPFLGMVRVITVKARSADQMAAAEEQINELLSQRHRISPRQEKDFTVRNLTQMMEAREQATEQSVADGAQKRQTNDQ